MMSKINRPSILDPDLDDWIAGQDNGQHNHSSTPPVGVLSPIHQRAKDHFARLKEQAEAHKEWKL